MEYRGRSNVLKVDGRSVLLQPGQVLCSTYLQKITFVHNAVPVEVTILTFNRAFYCIHTNDAEVSCNGLLFFGSDYSPILTLDKEEEHTLITLIAVLKDEFDTIDHNQEEMLRILLKRFIIRCTRLARIQLVKQPLPENQLDIIRMYNVLVEEHFKKFKQVADYADMMHRSPKTITNVFALQSNIRPLQIIHDRVVLEAKRLLLYTDKSSKEIAIELGFDDPSQFSRFFKKHVGLTTQGFKEKNQIHRFG
jgi:AraC-like DNA-binding protein